MSKNDKRADEIIEETMRELYGDLHKSEIRDSIDEDDFDEDGFEEFDEDDEDDFFNNPVGNIIICKSQKINFFRNFVIIIMECLNKALTKEECK